MPCCSSNIIYLLRLINLAIFCLFFCLLSSTYPLGNTYTRCYSSHLYSMPVVQVLIVLLHLSFIQFLFYFSPISSFRITRIYMISEWHYQHSTIYARPQWPYFPPSPVFIGQVCETYNNLSYAMIHERCKFIICPGIYKRRKSFNCTTGILMEYVTYINYDRKLWKERKKSVCFIYKQ